MSSISKVLIAQLQAKLITTRLVTETLIDMLIEKELFTKDEIDDRIYNTIEKYNKLVASEKEDLTSMINRVLEELPQKYQDELLEEDYETEEEVIGSMYYGPQGEA